MKNKKLTPRNAAPVKRENTAKATIPSPGCASGVLTPSFFLPPDFLPPFAGDDAE